VEMLANKGVNATLINVHTIKPFCKEQVLEAAYKSKMLFTVEEHSICGGLGGILSEILAENGVPVRLCRIGLEDVFAAGYGTHRSVRAENGLDAKSICDKIVEALK